MRGMLGYTRQFISELFNLKPNKYDITLDNKPAFTKKANMIVLANATKYGTGIEVNPDGKLDDGYFEVCIIKPFRWYQFFPILFSFLFRQLRTSPHVSLYRCKTANIINRDEEVLQVDGEIIGNPDTVDVEILPQAYRVIAPAQPTR
jgi:diacylglycerol kinase family enzyme